MSVFDPELKEFSETNFEKNTFSSKIEAKLLKALSEGKERFPDIVQCPNTSCGNPLQVEMKKEEIFLFCKNCGWKHMVQKNVEPSGE